MTPQIISQLLGISLAIATAIGCIAYEKLARAFCYPVMILIIVCSYLPFGLIALAYDNHVRSDLQNLSKYKWPLLIFAASDVTSICWYLITRRQSVIAGGIYEIKYVIVLALLYVAFGESRFTFNTAIGLSLAIASVYFISK